MEAVMCLMPNASLAMVQRLLQQHRTKAEVMHPGVRDATLARWYVLVGDSDADVAAAVHALQAHPAVDSAMLKPEGEAPD